MYVFIRKAIQHRCASTDIHLQRPGHLLDRLFAHWNSVSRSTDELGREAFSRCDLRRYVNRIWPSWNGLTSSSPVHNCRASTPTIIMAEEGRALRSRLPSSSGDQKLWWLAGVASASRGDLHTSTRSPRSPRHTRLLLHASMRTFSGRGRRSSSFLTADGTSGRTLLTTSSRCCLATVNLVSK